MSILRYTLIPLLILLFCAGALVLVHETAGHKEIPAPQKLNVTRMIPLEDGGITREVLLEGGGFTPQTHATFNLDSGNGDALLTRLPTWGSLISIAVRGDTAFLANGFRGVQAVDLRNPEIPRIIGSVKTKGHAWDLEIRDHYAFVAGPQGEFQVVDIRDPARLRRVAVLSLSGRCLSIRLQGDYAFLATSAGLQVVALHDPLHPRLVFPKTPEVTPFKLMDLAIDGDTAYLATRWRGLQIADISDPENPRVLSSYPDTTLHNLHLQGNRLYAGSHRKEMKILDISHPRSPKEISSFAFASPIHRIVVHGHRAYLATMSSGVQVLDLTDERSPLLVGQVYLDGATMDVVPWRDFVLVATGKEGLQIVCKARIKKPAGLLPIPSPLGKLVRMGKFLYLAENDLVTYEISSPGKIHMKGSLPLSEAAVDLEVSESKALISHKEGCTLVDLSDPAAPRPLHHMEGNKSLRHVTLSGDLLFAACGEEGFKIFRLQGTAPPLLVSQLDLEDDALKVAVEGDRAYILTSGGVQVLDVTAPEAPHPRSEIAFPWHYSIYSGGSDLLLQGNELYILNGRNGLIIISLDELTPQIAGFLDSPGYLKEINVAGDRAWLLDTQNGIHLVDIEDPTRMRILNTLQVFTHPWGLASEEDWLYVSTEVGLLTLPKPIEMVVTESSSPDRMRLKVPAPLLPGKYTLQLSQEGQRVVLQGAIDLRD